LQYFVTRKTKKSKARTLKGERNAILSTSVRACIFPLAIDDTFDGQPVVEFSRAIEETIKLTLPQVEAVHQKATRPVWDPPPKSSLSSKSGSSTLRRRVLPEILKARMKTVHHLCGNFMYGDLGLSDYLDGPEGDLEATMATSTREARIDMGPKEARRQLLEASKSNWRDSVRIMALVDKLMPLEADKNQGKVLVYDEFLQTLDVVSNALRAKGIRFYELNGHMTLGDRDTVLRKYTDPEDPVKVMLCTIQCGGLGLTLTVANYVFILTPRWNPSMDKQTIARANRVGQKRQVYVWHFYSNNSIERHVQRVRKKKEKKVKLVLHRDGVPQALRTRMYNWDEMDFRRHVGPSAASLFNMLTIAAYQVAHQRQGGAK
jgi:SNF2 family DNA or RNA helicase